MKIKNVYYGLAPAAVLAGASYVVMLSMQDKPDAQVRGPRTATQKNSETIFSLFDQRLQDAGANTVKRPAPAHPHNPINPATGKPYSDAAMARFELLRDVFPDNRMIPKRKSPRERKKELSRAQKEARKYYITTRIKILMGTAPRPVIDDYFSYRIRYTKDKVRLFQYALRNLPENASPGRKTRIEKLLRENELKLERALFQKQTAYKKSGISDSARL